MADGSQSGFVRTTCPYCGVGCGVLVDPQGTVKGDPDHPANFGKLCSKGSALGETLGDHGRLLYPTIYGVRASWDNAISTIAKRFSRTIRQYGPQSVAFYVSGQILIEDYYIANKLMKGFIGSANIDTNSRLCMASSVAGHKRAFGADIVPGCYEDLELADLIVFTGSNFAWCHPVLFQRVLAAKRQRPGMKIITIDPRATATSQASDIHLSIAPGSDTALFQGLLHYLYEHDIVDHHYVDNYTQGSDAARNSAESFTISKVAAITGLQEHQIKEFYQLYAKNERTVTVYSQGVNQAQDGTDRVNTIINAHLATGRIGKPGMGPFSITGQPNAMGGREVGGLANQLASHMDIANAEHRDRVQRFWGSPTIAQQGGLKAVDLFEALARKEVKAIWIMGTNPVVSMPNADEVRKALKACDTVVVSDIYENTDTARCADIVLPSTGWGEKEGMVTNSERRMSRQRAFAKPPGRARHDWQQFRDVAHAMGWKDAFNYQTVDEIFQEYAQLCSFENDGQRGLDLSGVTSIDGEAYERFAPTQWPILSGQVVGHKRVCSTGKFYTKNQKAQFIVPEASISVSVSEQYPFTLNTGRIRDQWHTMTRTGRASRLSSHIAEPFAEIAVQDAKDYGIMPADLVTIRSDHGTIYARALITERQQMGSIFVPMHWTQEYASNGRVDTLVRANPDPFSGQPALKSARVSIEKTNFSWHAFALIAHDKDHTPNVANTAYWARARLKYGSRFELAGFGAPINAIHTKLADQLFSPLLDRYGDEVAITSYCDEARQVYHYVLFKGDQLVGALYCGARPVSAARAYLCEALGISLDANQRKSVVCGRAGQEQEDIGAIVCSCMHVGQNQICGAIRGGCQSVASVGEKTGAGTNCGSCQSEIAKILESMQEKV